MSRRRRGRFPRISWPTSILLAVVVILGAAVLRSGGWGAVSLAVGAVVLLLSVDGWRKRGRRGRRKSRRRHS